MFTVTQVNSCFGGLIKCGPPFDGAVALVRDGACAFHPSTSPRWVKHLVVVIGGSWGFLGRLNTQTFLWLTFLFPSLLFSVLSPCACVGVLNKLQNQNKSQEVYSKCHGLR